MSPIAGRVALESTLHLARLERRDPVAVFSRQRLVDPIRPLLIPFAPVSTATARESSASNRLERGRRSHPARRALARRGLFALS
jgi:hypothetical protein